MRADCSRRVGTAKGGVMSDSWHTSELQRLLNKTIDQDIEIGKLRYQIEDLKWKLSLATTNGSCEVLKTIDDTCDSSNQRHSQSRPKTCGLLACTNESKS